MLTNSKSYNYVKYTLCILVMLIGTKQYAQTDLLQQAQDLCKNKLFDQAAPLIDKVVLHSQTKSEPLAWYIRSFTYISLYRQAGTGKLQKVNYLDTAFKSSIQSIKLDNLNDYVPNNKELIMNAAASYYKLSTVLLMDSLDAVKSELFYLKYKTFTMAIDPNFDTRQKDISYYSATGSLFADRYINNNFNQKYGDIAKGALLKVLELDPKNISANINLGIVFYNHGVALTKSMDYDVDLANLEVVQDNAKKLFKQSLPFMIKVYELNPQDIKALEGLQGIYHALLDPEKENEFKMKKEALNKK